METIGKYRILKQLGAGGFGAVYLAHDSRVNRDVAIKLFQPKEENLIAFATSSDEEGLAVLQKRFAKEAQILAQLEDSPYIVNVHDYGTLEDGSPWYVMQYVPKSLTDELGRDVFDRGAIAELPKDKQPKALPLGYCLSLMEQILKGLAIAHSHGLVHRDIKPSNILLNKNNEVRIADFGIAKAPDGQHSTVSHLGIGSRNYMAPEQRESAKQVDSRADIYSFGVLSYRMLTGKLPSGRYADPDVSVPQLSKAMNQLVLNCLSEDKEKRPKDGETLLALFQTAKAQTADSSLSETATFTDVSDNRSQSVIPQQLRPLATLIEDTLIEHGNLDSIQAEMRAMAKVLKADDQTLNALINEVKTSSSTYQAVMPLYEVITEAATGLNTVKDSDLAPLTTAAQLVGKDNAWVEARLKAAVAKNQSGVTDSAVDQAQKPPTANQAPPTKNQTNADAKPTTGNQQQQTEQPKAGPQASQESNTNSGSKSIGTMVFLLLLVVSGYVGWSLFNESVNSPVAVVDEDPSTGAPPAADKRWGLTLNTEPANARIRLPDITQTYSPAMQLPPGDYRVEVSASGYYSKTEFIKISDGSVSHRISLEKEIPLPEMVIIPAGSFQMGSNNGDDNEKPVHPVTVKSFKLAATELTVAQFRAFVDDTAYRSDAEKNTGSVEGCYVRDANGSGENGWEAGTSWKSPKFPQTDNSPVVCVSYRDVEAYLGWLNEKSGEHYRLPSESEWEYAARAGSTTKYHFGDNEDLLCQYGNGTDLTAFPDGRVWANKANCEDGYSDRTAPVGSFQPNGFGVYDMHGNVWEWVQDCWNASYEGAPNDGSAWMQGDCGRAVLRGGSWGNNPDNLRSANRYRYDRANRNFFYGFRIAQDL